MTRRRPQLVANKRDERDPLDGPSDRERATSAVLGCGALVVRLVMRDSRVIVGTCPRYDGGAWFRFHAFGELRARRILRARVQFADVAALGRHRDLVAVARAQRAGDFSGRALPRFRTTRAEATP